MDNPCLREGRGASTLDMLNPTHKTALKMIFKEIGDGALDWRDRVAGTLSILNPTPRA